MLVKKLDRIRIVLTAIFLGLWLSASSPTAIHANSEPDPVSIQITPQIQQAPGKVQYKISIARHVDNLYMCWGFTAPGARIEFRGSCQQLNGIYSPSVFWFEYKDLSAGEYQAFAELYRVPQRLAGNATANFIID